MEGFLPFTKSFFADVQLCPWKAYQHKVKRIKAVENQSAKIGSTVHEICADIRKGNILYDNWLENAKQNLKDKNFYDNECDEIITMVKMCILADPLVLSETEQQQTEIEKYFAIDKKGILTHDGKEAIAHGYIDRIILLDNGTVLVEDLKTERIPKDNIIERYLYVLGASAIFPDALRFIFRRFFLRTGTILDWTYQYSSPKRKELLEIYPDNTTIQDKQRQNPLLFYIGKHIDQIKKIDPIPISGPHCENWYGEPCQFLGNECPLASDVPQIIDDVIPTEIQEISLSGLLKAIAETKALPITAEQASWAYNGFIQLSGFLKKLETNLKEWSFKNGPIVVGDYQYGWYTQTENEVDKAFALSEMARAGMTWEEMAQVVSISKSSLQRISKKQYPQLREDLLALAITTKNSKPKFGLIGKQKEDNEF